MCRPSCRDYVVHGAEGPSRNKQRRCFHRDGLLVLDPGSCFVLTAAGAKLAKGMPGVY
jgi:hypothetical protein